MMRALSLFRQCLMGAVLVVIFMPAGHVWALDDGIVAVVDAEVITGRDLQDYMRGIYAQLKIEGRSDDEIREVMEKYKSKGVEQLIEDRLILAEANRQEMKIRPEAVNERLAEIQKRYPTKQEFLAEINAEGVTISDIRKKIEDQFKARFIVTKEVRDKIYVNPQQVTEYYNLHRGEFRREPRLYIQSVFVKAEGASDAQARSRIDTAQARIKAGEDFKAVSIALSDLPDIGEVSETSLNPVFKSSTSAMKVGDISDILTTDDGFYIIKLTGRTAAVEPTLQEMKNDIYQKLFEDKFKESFRAWIEKLRKKSYVEIKK